MKKGDIVGTPVEFACKVGRGGMVLAEVKVNGFVVEVGPYKTYREAFKAGVDFIGLQVSIFADADKDSVVGTGGGGGESSEPSKDNRLPKDWKA